MKPQVILVIAVIAVLAALPLGEGAWPCCDDCGICTRSIPPKCRCNDISAHGCHPKCKNCVRNTLTADDDASAGGPKHAYHCEDMIKNFCENRCTPATATAFLGEGEVF